jgi:hypothetical protein
MSSPRVRLPIVSTLTKALTLSAMMSGRTRHASAQGEIGTPSFRHTLARTAALDRSATMHRYWRHVDDVTGERLTVGEAHSSLLDALDRALGGRLPSRPNP